MSPDPNARPETGSMKFGEDWTGAFIRGDNAAHYAMQLSRLLEAVDQHNAINDPIALMSVKGLLGVLFSSNEHVDDPDRQRLKPFSRCLMPTTIDNFMGEYRFLSNFWPAKVVYDGAAYPTTEHAFQAAKTLDLAERAEIREADTAGKAKRLGQSVTLRPDWESIKIGVMEDLVRQKFAVEPTRSMLLATGKAELVEGNTWNDVFWGVCEGKGRNELGKILMRVRDALKGR